MELAARVIQHLHSISEPCNIVELAHALGVLEPGDVVPERLRSTLSGLVRHQQVKRLHNSDGVLRYQVIGGAIPPVPPPRKLSPVVSTALPVEAPAPGVAQKHPAQHHRTLGVSDRVLAALVAGEQPIMRAELERRLDPPLTTTQVVMSLQHLRKKGLVVKTGNTVGARWVLAVSQDDTCAAEFVPRAAENAAVARDLRPLAAAMDELLKAATSVTIAAGAVEKALKTLEV